MSCWLTCKFYFLLVYDIVVLFVSVIVKNLNSTLSRQQRHTSKKYINKICDQIFQLKFTRKWVLVTQNMFQNCNTLNLIYTELIYKMIFFFSRCNYIVLYGLKDDSLKLLTWISRLSLEWLKGTTWKSDGRASMMSKNVSKALSYW